MDEMSAEDCAKVVKKNQCEKKGAKCMISCEMCDSATTTPTTTADADDTTTMATMADTTIPEDGIYKSVLIVL